DGPRPIQWGDYGPRGRSRTPRHRHSIRPAPVVAGDRRDAVRKDDTVTPAKVWVDTWAWLAAGYRGDAHHLRVDAYWKQLQAAGTRFYTSDYVLDELINLLFRRETYATAVCF